MAVFIVKVYFSFLLLRLFILPEKKQWILASLIGFFLPITRIVGIFILPALVVEFFQQEKIITIWKKISFFEKMKLFLKFIPVCFISLSVVGYAIYNYIQKGDFLYFLHAHGNLANGRSVDSIVFFPQTIYRYGKVLFSVPVVQFEWWIALLEITIFLVVITLLVLAYKYKVRLSYIIFALLCFLLPVSSGTFSGLPRYVIVLFPIFITLMLIKNKTLKIVYGVVSIILLFILLLFFSKGYFIA